MGCRIVPFVPGRRATDEDQHAGLGSSDNVALITDDGVENRAILLFEVSDRAASASVTMTIDGQRLPRWNNRAIELTSEVRQRLEFWPARDLGDVDLSFATGFLKRLRVTIRVDDGSAASDEAWLDLCDARNLGSLYKRILEKLLPLDTTRQARQASVADPGVAYHPWYPVLKIGSDKASLYNASLLADIVGKERHLTDPAWLLRVGIYLELLTCAGIFEAVRDDVGDLLQPDERAAFESSDAFAEIRRRIDPAAWRAVWQMRGIVFPRIGSPRTGPVSGLNLLRKRNATLRFLHVHHEDLKHAIELAGPNHYNSQETWQRVFRDAERAVLRQAADAFPEIAFLPAAAQDVVLWQRFGFAGHRGVYPTACGKYRSSMNSVAEWGKARGLMNYASAECVPAETSLLEAYIKGDSRRISILQRHDGLGPNLTIPEPVAAREPTTEEIERLLAEVPIFGMLSTTQIRTLAAQARPLLLGPTERFLVEGQQGTSLFLVGEGKAEVRMRKADGTDWLVNTIGPGEVVGEMSLLTGKTRAATVRSVEETVIYEIGREAYEPLLVAHPEWVEQLARLMEGRLAGVRGLMTESEQETRRRSLRERIRSNFFGARGRQSLR